MNRILLSQDAGWEVFGLADSVKTGGRSAIYEVCGPPGGRAPWQAAPGAEIAIHVLDGEVEAQFGSTLYRMERGGSIYQGRGTPFRLDVTGSRPARLLLVSLPGTADGVPLETHDGKDGEIRHGAPHERIYLPDSRQQGRLIELGNYRGRCLLGSSQTGGALSLIHVSADPGSIVPLHHHAQEDEGMYVLSGRLTVRLGEREWRLGPGEFGYGPRHVPHNWRVADGDGPAEFLHLATPGGLEHFMAEVEPLMSSVPPNLPMLEAVCARYQIHFAE